ncbi:MAG: FG-GAP repeat [Rhodobacteraceae bacterium HLUCCA08]|nr:MAG: FG-GAP repeat [Rhodobacteraceae bacterium HLUCCA08]
MTAARLIAPLAAFFAGAVGAEITGADYAMQTDIYGHGAVPGGEYAAIEIRLAPDRVLGAALADAVYEDTAPRLVDLDGDGTPEVVTVISYFDRGAAIRIWDEVASDGHPAGTTIAVIAETAPIGQRHRWLAIAGIADFDGDGRVEIAYVDRPHLARVLRVVELVPAPEGWRLTQEAAIEGVTNHRFGAPGIEGGVVDCGAGPELRLARGDWSRIVGLRHDGEGWQLHDLGPYAPAALADPDC